MTLALSKTYGWSTDLGEATSYHLAILGIRAGRLRDWAASEKTITDRGTERVFTGTGAYAWSSEDHPFLGWVKESCLGLKPWQEKTYFEVNADWVLTAPPHLRTSLLQGISDGDGFVALAPQQVSIATHSNHEFIQCLLSSLGVKSIPAHDDVMINQSGSIVHLSELPMFRYARSRQDSLDELAEMIQARKDKPVGLRMSSEEIEFASESRDSGHSYGSITHLLYKRFGRSWDVSSVEHAIKRYKSKKE